MLLNGKQDKTENPTKLKARTKGFLELNFHGQEALPAGLFDSAQIGRHSRQLVKRSWASSGLHTCLPCLRLPASEAELTPCPCCCDDHLGHPGTRLPWGEPPPSHQGRASPWASVSIYERACGVRFLPAFQMPPDFLPRGFCCLCPCDKLLLCLEHCRGLLNPPSCPHTTQAVPPPVSPKLQGSSVSWPKARKDLPGTEMAQRDWLLSSSCTLPCSVLARPLFSPPPLLPLPPSLSPLSSRERTVAQTPSCLLCSWSPHAFHPASTFLAQKPAQTQTPSRTGRGPPHPGDALCGSCQDPVCGGLVPEAHSVHCMKL